MEVSRRLAVGHLPVITVGEVIAPGGAGGHGESLREVLWRESFGVVNVHKESPSVPCSSRPA